MAEYWKSTPSYWCKYCSIYVKDTPIERKNHEASGKHQGAIAKNLREIEKGKQREERDKQRAKDEVARLNGLVGGKGPTAAGSKPAISGLRDMGRSGAVSKPSMSAAAQRKAPAEQLLALGVELPEELKQEVTGVSSWQTVSERVVEEEQPRTLADIKSEEGDGDHVKVNALSKGVHKRRAEDEEEAEAASRRKAWGSKVKTYPGAAGSEDSSDLDALLSGVTKKSTPAKDEKKEQQPVLKSEDLSEDKPISAVPDVDAPPAEVKQEESEPAAPAVVFKRRKFKR